MNRPGISIETLVAAGIREVDGAMALTLCGLAEAGMWIPYLKLDGTALLVNGKPYGRIRLLEQRGAQKYHQRPGTGVHVYLPPGLLALLQSGNHDYVVVVEGEMKALCLVAMGIPAIGISGFYGFSEPLGDNHIISSELMEALHAGSSKRICFLGDKDTALNPQFADAACKFSKMLATQISLPRIPVDAPGKGIDDVRENLAERFQRFWQDILASAEVVDPSTERDMAVVQLAVRERDAFKRLTGVERTEAEQRIPKLAAAVHDAIAAQRLQEFAADVFNFKPRTYARAAKAEREKAARKLTGRVQWQEGLLSEDGRRCVILPGRDRELSAFAKDVGSVMGAYAHWFSRDGGVYVVTTDLRTGLNRFESLDRERAITSLERVIQTGTLVSEPSGDGAVAEYFEPQSMRADTAAALLRAEGLIYALPRVDRILSIPIPLLKDEVISLPVPGYNPAHHLWLAQNALQIPLVPIEDAKKGVLYFRDEFPFATDQAFTHYLAFLLTSFVKGLFNRWHCRTPLFVFRSNREGVGKDLAASIRGILLEGRAVTEYPVTCETVELEKRIVAANLAGRPTLHFAECEGHLNNPVLQGLITNDMFSGRVLGVSRLHCGPNEMDVSLSGKNDLTLSPDLTRRSRTISLELFEEDVNARVFRSADLPQVVLKHRVYFISALLSLVADWDKKSRPSGPTPFASFPEWGRVVGGVLVSAGLGDPCLPEAGGGLPVDRDTMDMKSLFDLMHQRTKGEPVTSGAIMDTLGYFPEENWFSWLDLQDRTAFPVECSYFHIIPSIMKYGTRPVRFSGFKFRGRPDSCGKARHLSARPILEQEPHCQISGGVASPTGMMRRIRTNSPLAGKSSITRLHPSARVADEIASLRSL